MDINTYEIILTDVAKEELEFIYEYISKTLSAKKAADNLMEKIEKSILMLEKTPYACKEVSIKSHNELYRRLIVDKYIVLYQIEEKYKQVVIYKVIYSKRDYINIEE